MCRDLLHSSHELQTYRHARTNAEHRERRTSMPSTLSENCRLRVLQLLAECGPLFFDRKRRGLGTDLKIAIEKGRKG